MIAELGLASSMLLSLMVQQTDQQMIEHSHFIEMSNEDYEDFMDANYDMIDTVVEFVDRNSNALERGGLVGVLGYSFRAFISKNPLLGVVGIQAASELVKSLYKESDENSDSKKIADMQKSLKEAIQRIDQLEGSQSYLDFDSENGGHKASPIKDSDWSYGDTSTRHHMSENSRDSSRRHEMSPSERRRERINPRDQHERERDRSLSDKDHRTLSS